MMPSSKTVRGALLVFMCCGSQLTCAGANREKPDPYANKVMYGPPKDAAMPKVPRSNLELDSTPDPGVKVFLPSASSAGDPKHVTRAQLNALMARGPAYVLSQVTVKPFKESNAFQGFEIKALSDRAKEVVSSSLQVGDVITHLNGVRLQKPKDYLNAWKLLHDVQEVRLDYVRAKQPSYWVWRVLP